MAVCVIQAFTNLLDILKAVIELQTPDAKFYRLLNPACILCTRLHSPMLECDNYKIRFFNLKI